MKEWMDRNGEKQKKGLESLLGVAVLSRIRARSEYQYSVRPLPAPH